MKTAGMKWLLCLLVVLSIQAGAQNNISRLEYFIDTDPGFGQATNVSITPATSISNQAVNIDISGVANGIHNVYFRSRNNNGWSVTNRVLFLKQQVNAANVSKLEYWLDNTSDPGFGNAVNVGISPGDIVNDVVIPVNIGALNNGIHSIHVRSRDNNGRWSNTNRWLFLKQSINASQVSRLEYFFDNAADPGFGNATNIPVTPANSVNDVVAPLNISGLSNGIHHLYLRSRDNQGTWSITNRWVFVKMSANSSQVTRMEYYVDNIADPGFGKATPVSINPDDTVNNVMIPVNVNALTNGIHSLYVRSADNGGNWSITNRWLFIKEQAPATNVTKMEYYLNTDPGFGKATNVSITPGSSVNDVVAVINAASLSNGLNNLYLRSQNSNGSWSLTNRWLFINEQRNGLVDKIEYYYDNDPGFGNGIPIAINAVSNTGDMLVPVNVTGLSTGIHVMYLRTHSARGWSITNKDTFNVTATTPTPYINVNSVTQKINCAWNSFRISFHATGTYNAGNHFTVQLSDKDGSFANPIVIGDTATTRSSEVYCVLPSHMQEGTNYRVRVVSSNTLVTGVTGVDALTIHDRPELGADTTVYILCQGETVNLVPLYNTAGYTTAAWNTNDPEHAPAANYKLIVGNVYGCKDTANAFVKQDVAIWTGAISKNWHVAGNWSNNHIPTEKTHVIVQGVVTNPCEISVNDGVAASVQVKSSGNIKLLNNYKLMISANCNPLPTGQ